MQRSYAFIALLIAAMTWGTLAGTAGAATPPAEVDASIRKAIDYLYTHQQNGNWELVGAPLGPPNDAHDSTQSGQWGGMTAITTYALLSAAQTPKDAHIQSAVQFLMQAQMRGTYAISMRANVWPLLPPTKQTRDAAARDAKLLLDAVHFKGKSRGNWGYYVDKVDDDFQDHSASQMAVLGMWACAQTGVEVRDAFWSLEDSAWRTQQMPEGAWCYVADHPNQDWGKPYLSMTVAGLCTLFITQDQTYGDRRINCTGNGRDANVDKGLAWVAANFPSAKTGAGATDFGSWEPHNFFPGGPGRDLYLLFGIQRLGAACGYRYFGVHDWFQEGADYLIKTQHPDGSWGGDQSTTWETALGLLFMARGRDPVAFNKLDYTNPAEKTAAAWNQRPRDLANLTDWTSKQTETRLHWQIVDFASDPMDWTNAPVLYLAGSDELKFTDQQLEKLRQYVQAGGLIMGNADCGSETFSNSFRKLGQSLFPDYEFRELPPDHPLLKDTPFPRAKWKHPLSLAGLSNGVRELMILLPSSDPGKSWQLAAYNTHEEAFAAASDVFFYAGGLGTIRYNGESYVVRADPAVTATQHIKMARLQYGGNWDPEPGGWRQLAAVLHNTQHTDLTVETVALGAGKLDSRYTFAHLTGTSAFSLSDGSRDELRKYVESGGTLLIDAAGGSGAFADSVESELMKIFPDGHLQRIESSHPLLASPVDAGKVSYRKFTREVGASSSARLQALMLKGRPAVIYSSLDLSAGLVGNDVDGISGYSPSSAVAIVTDLLLHPSIASPAIPNAATMPAK